MLTMAPYQGNIRELENEIERIITLADDNSEITPDLLSPRFHSINDDKMIVTEFSSLKENVENLERTMILKTLKDTKGNILRAAEILHLSRAGLHKKLNRYKINSKNL